MISNTRYTIGESNRSKGGTMIESLFTNTSYTTRDSNGSKGEIIMKCILSNARYTLRDNRILATIDKSICCSFNNSIAILTTIICTISLFNDYRSEPRAIRVSSEGIRSDTLYAVRDNNRGKGRTIAECKISNTCYAIRYNNRGEGGAMRESSLSNTCYAV